MGRDTLWAFPMSWGKIGFGELGVRVACVIYMIIFGGDLIASGIIKFP